MDTLLCVSGVCKWCVMFHSIVHRVIYIHKYMHTCNTYVRTCMFVQKFSICVILKVCANFNEQSLPMFYPIAVAFFRVSNAHYQFIGQQIKLCQNLTHCLLLSRDTVCRALTVYCRVCHSPHAHDYVCMWDSPCMAVVFATCL